MKLPAGLSFTASRRTRKLESYAEGTRYFSGAFGKDIYSLLKAEESVKNKKSAGSTAPAEILKQIRRLGKIEFGRR